MSGYAGKVEVDEKTLRKLLQFGINSMGRKNGVSSLLWVAETPEAVLSGIMFGIAQPVYGIGNLYEAKDVMFFGRAGVADAQDMAALFRRFMTWAESDERVYEIRVSTSGTMMANWREFAPYYLSRGFQPDGDVFVRRIDR